jgi:hypothetical protein
VLEGIVRPFQSPGVTATARIVIATEKTPPEPAVLQWGAAGSLAQPVLVQIATIKFPNENKYVEKSRTTETVRVKNKDDPTQFVDVARIKNISFQPTTAMSPAGSTTLAPPTNPDGTQTPGGQQPVDGVPPSENTPQPPPTAPPQPSNEEFQLKPPPGDGDLIS